MDANVNECNSNHLDADVLLPPRKRLLAGLKKQNCSESTSQCSQENNPSSSLSLSPSPSPSPLSPIPLSEFDARLNNLLRSYKNGSNMSPKEIADAAGSAAQAAAKLAEAARAAAEEKAAVAAKAVAAAKNALDLVASVSEDTGVRDKYLRKSKLKKHVPVQMLYNKYQPVQNCGKDEELARSLHQAMNSSPRISKHKHKKLKISPPNEKSGVSNVTSVRDVNGKLPLGGNEDGIDCEGSNDESYTIRVENKVSKSSKPDEIEVNSTENYEPSEDMCINGRKRGRTKQKKLPLSICSFKDKVNPKEQNLTNPPLTRVRADNSASRHISLLSMEPCADKVTPMKVAPTWKGQDFKVPQCIKQDKVVQS